MAGGFMSGFGKSFANTYSAGVKRYQDEQQDLFKTSLELGLKQKTAYEKAQAEDAKYISDAKAIVSLVPGAPDEAYKLGARLLRAGYSSDEVEDKLRKTTFSAVETAEQPDTVQAPTQEAQTAPVDAQMQEAMGEPVPQPEAPTEPVEDVTEPAKEEGGIFSSIKGAIKKGRERREERIEGKVRDTLGVSEDEYSQIMNGYTPEDLTMENYTFTIPNDDSEASTFSQAMLALAKQDERYLAAVANGDLQGAGEILKSYENMGTASKERYPYTGTDASLKKNKFNAEKDLRSDDPEIVRAAQIFLEVDYPSLLLAHKQDAVDSITDSDERLTVLFDRKAELEKKLDSASPEEASAISEELATIDEDIAVTNKTMNYKRTQSKPKEAKMWVKDPRTGGRMIIDVREVQDANSDKGFSYADASGNPVIPLGVPSENDTTIVEDYRTVADNVNTFNTETIPKVPTTLLLGKRISDTLRGPYGRAAINATGSIATLYDAGKNNLINIANTFGYNIEGEGKKAFIDEATFLQNFEGGKYSTLEEMAFARNEFNANFTALTYIVADAMFGQSGRGLSDADFERAQAALMKNANNPEQLARFIDRTMKDYLDSKNRAANGYLRNPRITAYKDLLDLEETPDNARAITVSEYIQGADPNDDAVKAVQYYMGYQKPKETSSSVVSGKLTQAIVTGFTAKNPDLGARLQELLDAGATTYKIENGRVSAGE